MRLRQRSYPAGKPLNSRQCVSGLEGNRQTLSSATLVAVGPGQAESVHRRLSARRTFPEQLALVKKGDRIVLIRRIDGLRLAGGDSVPRQPKGTSKEERGNRHEKAQDDTRSLVRLISSLRVCRLVDLLNVRVLRGY
jgi:hypothetical protein